TQPGTARQCAPATDLTGANSWLPGRGLRPWLHTAAQCKSRASSFQHQSAECQHGSRADSRKPGAPVSDPARCTWLRGAASETGAPGFLASTLNPGSIFKKLLALRTRLQHHGLGMRHDLL